MELIDTNIPKALNCEILDHLGTVGWKFASDKQRNLAEPFHKFISGNKVLDKGMFISTFERPEVNHTPDPILNNFGKWVFYLVQQRSSFSLLRPYRMFWNFYTPVSKPEWHCDDPNIGSYVSILYNLHDNDGGTEFQSGEKIESKEGQAIVFESHLTHRGYAPTEVHHRFNLNMICLTK
jgi:hypothetical protein